MTNITFIGAGNVAWHLAQAFFRQGFKIAQVWSRTKDSADKLAQLVDALATDDLNNLTLHNGIFIISLNDDALPLIVNRLHLPGNLVLHTSGTVEREVLDKVSAHNGVLYPLQTFTKGVSLDISKVPFLIEGSSAPLLETVKDLALSLSPNVFLANSEQRLKIHVAAVFAGNYTNYLYSIASELLNGSGYNLDLMRPLIEETSRKAMLSEPETLQTGPARRGDLEVIRKHIKSLASKPEYAEIYRQLAGLIINKYYPGSIEDAEL
jgi:predicted short-subunit dehydrogenase-like oxidoreductase (DUF2520 family)